MYAGSVLDVGNVMHLFCRDEPTKTGGWYRIGGSKLRPTYCCVRMP